MCVAQFREYCKAFSFKNPKDIKPHHETDTSRGTFNGKSYVKDKKKMEILKKRNNIYALNDK